MGYNMIKSGKGLYLYQYVNSDGETEYYELYKGESPGFAVSQCMYWTEEEALQDFDARVKEVQR